MTKRDEAPDPVFGEVIYAYTRAQALADGVLVDASAPAREAGIRWPVAMTAAVFARYVRVPEQLAGWQDEKGRMWDVVWMLRCGISGGNAKGRERLFKLLVNVPHDGALEPNERLDQRNPERAPRAEAWDVLEVTLKAEVGPGDDGEPVITVLLPGED